MVTNPEAFISSFYNNAIVNAKKVIDGMTDSYLASVDVDELVEYIVQEAGLPQIIEDQTREKDWKKSHRIGRDPYWPEREVQEPLVKVYLPIVPSERLGPVLRLLPGSSYTLSDEEILLEGDNIIIVAEPNNIEGKINDVRGLIERKNKEVVNENERLGREMRDYLQLKIQRTKDEDAQIEEVIKRLSIKLVKREDTREPSIDLRTKKHIKVLKKPEPKKKGEVSLFLERDKVLSVIELIKNSGHSFERTPKVYSELQEEDLRDILLGSLNTIFEGGATGETFSKKGKTDIYLQVEKGSLLIMECKFWDGQKQYKNTIDQLFEYLTWRENYGIIILFSKNSRFSDVIEKAKQSTIDHATYLGDLEQLENSHFQTQHRFPEDELKRVEIHHLLFNLYFQN